MLSVRRALESDMQRFLDWRNDPAVVAASFNSEEIAMRDHQPWYLRRLASNNCGMYVVEHDSVPAGQVRFDIDGATATINYSLDATFRGRGLATASVDKAIAVFHREHPGVTKLVAYVKSDNIASCRVFEKLDFEADGFDNEVQANRYLLEMID